MSANTSFIPDIPSHPGPLQDYRNKATFDWKLLRIYFESEEKLKEKYLIWNQLEKDPLFKRPPVTLPVDEQKKLAAMRMKRVSELGFLTDEIKNSSYQKRVKYLYLYKQILQFQRKLYFSVEAYDESKRSFSRILSKFFSQDGSWNWTFLQCFNCFGQ